MRFYVGKPGTISHRAFQILGARGDLDARELKLASSRYRSRDGRDTVSLGLEGGYFSSTRKQDGQQKPRGRGFSGTNLQNLQIYKFTKVT